MKKILSFILTFALVLSVAPFQASTSQAKGKPVVKEKAVVVVVGATKQLKVCSKDGVASAWTSSNEAIATVSSSGVVSGAAVGTATISVTVTKNAITKVKTFPVKVIASAPSPRPTHSPKPVVTTKPVEKQKAVLLEVGKATQIKTCAASGASITFTSADSAIADVSSAGVVSGVAIGTTTITVSVTVNSVTVVKAFSVKVVAAGSLVKPVPTKPVVVKPNKPKKPVIDKKKKITKDKKNKKTDKNKKAKKTKKSKKK